MLPDIDKTGRRAPQKVLCPSSQEDIMHRRKVRVGIDVGGTFTDAALIDNETFEVIEK